MPDPSIDRRSLLAAGATIGVAAVTAFSESASAKPASPARTFTPQPLPFDPATIAGLSEKLLVSHHDNNYVGAVKRLGAITAQFAALDPATAPNFTINGLKREELIAWNSMILHELYFAGFGKTVAPAPALAHSIERDFGSFDRWATEFAGIGKALGGGSGWVLLTWSHRDKCLVNQWAADHTMTLAGGTPILALDMYEHAYALDYGAKAAAYVDAYMKAIDWTEASVASRRSQRTDMMASQRHRALLMRLVAPAAVLLAPVAPARAQTSGADGLDLSASVRLRYETVDGQARAGFNDADDLLNLRTIVTAQYKSGPVKLVAEVYDGRAWLADRRTPLTTNEVNAVELVQAYAAVDMPNAIGDGTSLTLQGGRFLLNIGSRRLVAADDYRNTTNGYTGLRADVSGKNGLRGTFIYVLPQVRLPDDLASLLDNKARFDRESFDLVLWGGTVARSKTIGPATAELSFYHLGERDAPGRPSRDRSLNTIGGRVIRDPKAGAFDYEAEAYYQFGHVSSGLAASAPRLNVSASFVHADIGYTFSGGWKPRLSIEFDRASGDGIGGSYGRFDTLFGMRRADLAPAGLFNAVGRANIATPGVRLEVSPSKMVDGFIGYRAMWLADRTDAFSTTGVRDATGRSGNFAGHQVDARVRYWLVPDRLRFEVDGVWLAKGRFLRRAPNAPANGDTRYLSLNLTASF